MKTTCLTVLITLFPFFINAQDFWEEVPTNGFNVKKVTMNDFGRLFISARCIDEHYDGIFSTENHGLTWDTLYKSNTGIFALEVYENVIYFSDRHRLIKSIDEGFSWDTTYIGEYKITTIYKANNHLYIGSDKICRSEDNGQNWDTIRSLNGGEAYIYDIVETPEGILLYAKTNWLYRGAIGRSVDGGDTWIENCSEEYFSCLTRTQDGTLYAGTSLWGALFMSYDNGETWEENDLVIGGNITSMTATPDGDVLMSCSHHSGSAHIYQSTDYGTSWNLIPSDLVGPHSRPSNIRALKDGHYYSTPFFDMRYKLYRSSEELYNDIPIIANSEKKYKIYPNPTQDFIWLETNDAKDKIKNIRIYNVYGKLLTESSGINTDSIQLLISDFVSGVYLISLQINQQTFSGIKLVKL